MAARCKWVNRCTCSAGFSLLMLHYNTSNLLFELWSFPFSCRPCVVNKNLSFLSLCEVCRTRNDFFLPLSRIFLHEMLLVPLCKQAFVLWPCRSVSPRTCSLTTSTVPVRWPGGWGASVRPSDPWRHLTWRDLSGSGPTRLCVFSKTGQSGSRVMLCVFWLPHSHGSFTSSQNCDILLCVLFVFD